MVVVEGQARQPLLYPAFRSGRAYQHPLVPTFSLNRPSAGATFPAYPSVNHRRARFM